jgi:hypothetical protein
MKQHNFWSAMAALCGALTLMCAPVWATRAVGAKITGQITATPSSAQIEVDHHVYLIQKNTPAAKVFRNFYFGDSVELTLERHATDNAPTVVSIVKHVTP